MQAEETKNNQLFIQSVKMSTQKQIMNVPLLFCRSYGLNTTNLVQKEKNNWMRFSLRCALHHSHRTIVSVWHVSTCFTALIKMFYVLFLFFPPVPCQLADTHYNSSLLRQCVLGWSMSMKASQSDKQASADQLYQRFLLRWSLSCWKEVCIHKNTITLETPN